MKTPHFVIMNAVALNTGDAAILYGLLTILKSRFPDGFRVTVFNNQPEAAARYHSGLEFRRSLFAGHRECRAEQWVRRLGYGHWNNRVRALRFRLYLLSRRYHLPLIGASLVSREERVSLDVYDSADAAISTGGTYLVEVYSLDSRIRELELGPSAQLPLVLFTQSLGPFTRGPESARLRQVVTAARAVLLRDERSRRHLLEIGVPDDRIVLAADAAFALASNGAQRKRYKSGAEVGPRIAISVRRVRSFLAPDGAAAESRFFDGVAALTRYAVNKHRAHVVFLSTCQGAPEYTTDDSLTADGIIERLPHNYRSHVTVDRAFRTPKELSQAYSHFDLLVATRMHAAILALCKGTPVIGLAYEFKITELFADMGIPELCLPIKPWLTDRAESTLDHVLEHQQHYSEKITTAVREFRQDALNAGRHLPISTH